MRRECGERGSQLWRSDNGFFLGNLRRTRFANKYHHKTMKKLVLWGILCIALVHIAPAKLSDSEADALLATIKKLHLAQTSLA